MPDKEITGWLIVDWKDETHRTRQSKPKTGELTTNELVAKLSVDVTVPEVEVPTLSVEIDVPEPQVYAATLEALDDEDLPDWSGVANDKVEGNRVAFKQADTHADWESEVNATTVTVLQEAQGRPDVDNVREYVERMANRVVDEQTEDGAEATDNA